MVCSGDYADFCPEQLDHKTNCKDANGIPPNCFVTVPDQKEPRMEKPTADNQYKKEQWTERSVSRSDPNTMARLMAASYH
jgi:hypothetical protein